MENYGLNMPELNLPQIDLKSRQLEGQRTEIFDQFRKKFVILNPEEWVRQHMLHYLITEFKYPANLLGVEVSMKRDSLLERADIVVYNNSLKPLMIIECKAASVNLSQQVFEQAARYNLSFGVSFIAITNGLRLIAAQVNPENQSVSMLKSFPSYSQLNQD
jgi:hypothetical protein